MSKTLDYVKVSNKNLKAENAVMDAVVVANYGDPGLDEDYHADILSRYVICKIESSNRTLTSDRYKNMIVVVKRPELLWISYQDGFLNDPVNQRRVDANLNVNVGMGSSYAVNSIPKINYPYALGEKIKIKLINNENGPAYTRNEDKFFHSECNEFDNGVTSQAYYGSWHTQGLNSNPYIAQNNGSNNLRLKTISKRENDANYSFRLNKYQYEAFALTLFPESSKSLIKLFTNASNYQYYYETNGGYLFSNAISIPLNFVKYEDMNTGGKARTSNTSCIPLIVASPQTFTVPKTRQSGTVNYTPTYIEKS